MKYNLRQTVRLANAEKKLELACMVLLMNMLVGPIDYFASKINFLTCALHFSKTLKRTFSDIPFKMLKI
jgi:hypothetical protein